MSIKSNPFLKKNFPKDFIRFFLANQGEMVDGILNDLRRLVVSSLITDRFVTKVESTSKKYILSFCDEVNVRLTEQ